MEKKQEILKNSLIIILIILMSVVIFMYQRRKIGYHEDEMFTIASSVNADNGLMTAYKNNDLPANEGPAWKTKEFVKNYVTLTPNNYLNLISIYTNQACDNHPPFFYTLVHFASILFGGQFSKYTVFVVNIIAFIISCFIIKKILEILNKENLTIGALIFYGLSMGTISMVIFQRMYMLLTMFVLLYFYYTIKLYKNDFKMDKKTTMQLGAITVLGFLTQYYFAVYAFLMFIMVIIKMIKEQKQENIKKYFIVHIVYAVIGILLFVPCIAHLLFSDRGLSNLGNSNFLDHFGTYVKWLAYAFSVKDNVITILVVFAVFLAGVIYLYKKAEDKFIVLLTIIPSVIYFFVTVKMTSFQELRYIMPVIPFVVLTLFMVLNKVINIKYKNAIIVGISIVLVIIGFCFSAPKFLYKDYEKYLKIAKENSEKSFVYVYDNFFCHIQSIPEMMIYEKTLIINTGKDEVKNLINDEQLNKEESYILSIKSYLNNDEIIDNIKNNTEFKNIQKICSSEGETRIS